MLIYTFLIFGILKQFSCVQDDRKLLFSQILMRHAETTPFWIYKNSKCPAEAYYDGLGELTTNGISMSYFVGTLLKNKLIDTESLLPNNFSHSKLSVISSSGDKCIETALAVLAGLYPSVGTNREWRRALDWQPIAVNVSEKDKDILRLNLDTCDKLKNKMDNIIQGKPVKEIFDKNKEFIKFLEDNIGETLEHRKLSYLYTTLLIENSLSKLGKECLVKPEFATEENLERIKSILQELHLILYNSTDIDSRLLLGGLIFGDMYKNIDNFIRKNSAKSVIVYSGDYISFYALNAALGINNNEIYPHNFMYALELYGDSEWKSYQVELRRADPNAAETTWINVDLPHCKSPCSPDSLYKNYKNVISKDRLSECAEKTQKRLSKMCIGFIVLGVIFIIYVVISIAIIVKLRRSAGYASLDS